MPALLTHQYPTDINRETINTGEPQKGNPEKGSPEKDGPEKGNPDKGGPEKGNHRGLPLRVIRLYDALFVVLWFFVTRLAA